MNLPEQVGVMLLPQTVFFPHELLPLHIFEHRYRKMLQEALEGSRMFAVAMDSETGPSPSRVGGLGLIRTCVRQDDGTSNLILQGIARVRLDHLVKNRPYLIASPEPMEDPEESTPQSLATQESLELNESEAIKIMQVHNSIIKRPIVDINGDIIVGFDETAYTQKISSPIQKNHKK